MVDLLRDFGTGILLQKMSTRYQFGSLGMRQEFLETRRERHVIEYLVLSPPHEKRGEFRSPQLAFQPFEACEPSRAFVERNPARPRPRQQTRARIRQYTFVDALCLGCELLSIDHRQIHAAAGKSVVTPEKIRTHDG